MTTAFNSWLSPFGTLFNQNGYRNPPEDIYTAFLRVLDSGGKVLELGCGNGLLLRYLFDHSPQVIVPYGVDINPRSIETAKASVFPCFAEHFSVGDARQYKFPATPVDVLITNPLYADEGYYKHNSGHTEHLCGGGEMRAYVERCILNLSPCGQLILFAYLEELRGADNFWEVFEAELAGLPLSMRPSELGHVCLWTHHTSPPRQESEK